MKGHLPLGNPHGEVRPPMKMMSFKAPPDVCEALKLLESQLGSGVRAKRSVILRTLILEAAAEYERRRGPRPAKPAKESGN